MTDALTAAQPEYAVQISHQPHAFLVANITLHDLGADRRVDVGLGGVKYPVTVSSEALRAAPNLTGHWRATLFIRTRRDGSLERITQVRRLRPVTDSTQSAFWTCTGLVKGFNREELVLELEVGLRAREPFSLHARCSVAQGDQALLTASQGQLLHATGSLDGGRLYVSTLEAKGNPRADPVAQATASDVDGDDEEIGGAGSV